MVSRMSGGAPSHTSSSHGKRQQTSSSHGKRQVQQATGVQRAISDYDAFMENKRQRMPGLDLPTVAPSSNASTHLNSSTTDATRRSARNTLRELRKLEPDLPRSRRRKSKDEVVLVYPNAETKDAVTLTEEDIERLGKLSKCGTCPPHEYTSMCRHRMSVPILSCVQRRWNI